MYLIPDEVKRLLNDGMMDPYLTDDKVKKIITDAFKSIYKYQPAKIST